ncbi:MAG: sugar ABC transporter substrate-binding protein [Pseudomonadota bacterium]
MKHGLGRATRRQVLGTMGLVGAGAAANLYLPRRARAQVSTAESLILTDEEVAEIRGRGLRLGFNMNHRTDDFINSVVEGGELAASEYDIDLLISDANFDAAKQISDIESLLQQQVDGIFMIAVDSDSISSAIRQANRQDVPVVVVGGPPSRGDVLSVMNSASYEGCFQGTQALLDALGGGAGKRIGVISIPLGLQTIRDREQGSIDAIEQAGAEMVAMQGVWSQDEALTAAQNIIQANPDLDGIFANWSRAIPGAWRAIEESDREILLCGYDAERDGMQALHSGEPALQNGQPILRALSGQQGILTGRAGIDALCKNALGETVQPDILVPTVLVTHDNVEEMWNRLYPDADPPWAG